MHGDRPGHRGFDDPVFDAQSTFRTVMDAMAQPGVAHRLEIAVPDTSLAPAATAILLALTDTDTTVWLGPDIDEQIGDLVRFQTGARTVDDPAAADFAVSASVETITRLDQFRSGSFDAPELAATVIVSVHSFSTGVPALLRGPGIEVPRAFAPAGFLDRHWDAARENSARFPLGIDLLFVSGREIAALPRSTRIDHQTTGAR
jgi:alpha-D-ribose 1-methylphosphonate 5-triphosphate synthase subunit PhnH